MVRRSPRNAGAIRVRWLARAAVALALLGSLGSFAATPSLADHSPQSHPRAVAESLTQALLGLHAQHRAAGAALQAQSEADLVTAAAAREQYLAALIHTDPAEVLRVAIPAGVRALLPPAVQAYVEEDVEVEGTLEVLHEDRDQGSRYLHYLDTGGKRFSLHFAADAPKLETGSYVRVRGLRLQHAMALSSGSADVQALAAPPPNTFGTQQTAVILVNFSNNPVQPYTVATAQSVVLGTTSNFYLENSYQQTSLAGSVHGWFTIALSSTVCDAFTLASQANAAATAAGVNLANYSRRVYAFPQNACGWWGLGTVGGNPSQAWINGSLQLRVVAHELGHNVGLYHSHALECGSVTVGSSCSNIEYGDTLDVMGSSSGHFNAFQKERLGWLNFGSSPPVTTVTSSGTYFVDGYETLGANPKALKVLRSTNPQTGKKDWFYVELRRATGFDSFLSNNTNVLNGVVIHLGSESSPDTSNLLDMTPATTSWNDPALAVGQTFTDPVSGVSITPTAINSGSATVVVTFGSGSCVRANPTVAISPSQSQFVPAGTTVTYTITVTNLDSTGCAPSSFTLQRSVPSGWTGTFGASALTIGPGAAASTTLQVTSPTSAPAGFNTITVTATNSVATSFTGSASATYVVSSLFTLTVMKQGTGSGTVTSNPAGINCGSACQASFSSSPPVTLTAAAASGSTFAGWSGGGCSGTGTCTVTLTANTTVTATFNPATNQAPVVSAGANQTITLPGGANLSGSATDDGLPNPPGQVTTTWSKASGPGTVTFGNPAALTTTATFSTAGTYVLRLTANDGALSSSATVTVTVSPPSPPPGPATLIAPAGPIGTARPTYTWNAVASATSYLLWVNDSMGPAKIAQWLGPTTVGCGPGTGTCSFTPSTTLAPGAARWWVQTWNPAGYGPWSAPLDFTVAPPGPATLIAPAGPIGTARPTYTWNAVASATSYLLWVNDSMGPAKIAQWLGPTTVGCGPGTGTCSFTPSTTLAPGAARWWVQTWNPAGYGPWSAPLDFTVP